MNKLLVALTLTFILVFSSGLALAADTAAPTAAPTADPAITAPVVAPTVVPAAIPPASDELGFPGLNLQGDTLYLFRAGVLALGVGTDLASMYDGLVTLRAEVVKVPTTANVPGSTMVGAGATVNLPKLINKFGGQWQSKVINPSVGLMPLYNFTDKRLDFGILVSIIRINL